MLSSNRSQVTVFFQEACYSHHFIRSRDTSTIVERPQRLHAVKIGVATAIARLEQCRETYSTTSTPDFLATALEQLNLSESTEKSVNVIMSASSVDILRHPAVMYIHGDVDGNIYLEKLVNLVRESEEKVARGESEIPEGLSQGDLYLCKNSLAAIQGAIGAVCEAVDTVLQSPKISHNPTNRPPECPSNDARVPPKAISNKAFVAIRPPGHHCGEDTPSGFCFVNNVAIGAAHAHLQYDISRVVILDIDLHHGNGTQSIAWQINEEKYRQEIEPDVSHRLQKPSLKIYYGSIHDVLSYPCEDGNATLIQAASVSLHGPHGQHIENVHLLPYESDQDFWDRLYSGSYASLLQKAEAFLKEEQPCDAMVFISAGFDASEHEYSSMSRHGRKVPTGFYHRFARDARKIADQYAQGRIVSVLEGGYSDRALSSGTMAHVLGLAEEGGTVDTSWWSLDNLIKVEKATKKQRNGRSSGVTTAPSEKWLERTLSVLSTLSPNPSRPPTPKLVQPSTMTLRDRSKRSNAQSLNPSESEASPLKSQSTAISSKEKKIDDVKPSVENVQAGVPTDERALQIDEDGKPVTKKLPRVILKVNPPALGTNARAG